MDGAVGIFRHLGHLGGPRCGEGGVISLDPMGLAHHFDGDVVGLQRRSEEHTSELQSLMRISYAVFSLTKKSMSKSTPQQILIYTSLRLTTLTDHKYDKHYITHIHIHKSTL